MGHRKHIWIITGLFWGALMFLFNTILWPLSQHDPLTPKRLLVGVVIWTCTGLLFGWLTNMVKWTKKAEGE